MVRPKDGRRTAWKLQAHAACRRERATIQDVAVGILCLNEFGFAIAQGGNCALAEAIVVTDTSVAAIRILNVVIVVLRDVVCGEFAPAITAARLRTFPLRDFSRQSSCRRCLEESSSDDFHACANGVRARVL